MITTVWNNGHGGPDPGGVAPTKQTEAKTNYNVAEKAVSLQRARGVNAVLTNPKIAKMTPATRARMANELKAHVYVSIHHNMGGGEYTLLLYDMNDPRSKVLAEYVKREILAVMPKRVVKIEYRESVKYPGHNFFSDLEIPTCPALLVEYAFLDSADLQLVNTFRGQYTEAEILDKAVTAFATKELKLK